MRHFSMTIHTKQLPSDIIHFSFTYILILISVYFALTLFNSLILFFFIEKNFLEQIFEKFIVILNSLTYTLIIEAIL